MNSYSNILSKLDAFHRRYYTRMLVKGVLLFSILGMLIIFGVLSVEYALWLAPTGRLILFWIGIAAELYLLARFIIRPLFYLLKFRQGIDNKEASLLIGKHFPEIGDKLYNLLDLSEDQVRGELLIASIEQRSKQLSPVPFNKAIDFNGVRRLSRFLILPVAVLLLIWVSGNLSDFFGSYTRVVNYQTAYQPPAPFEFETLMGDLEVLETERFTVQVRTRGRVVPENLRIHVQGKDYLLHEDGGFYNYTFEPPLQSVEFYFSANGVESRRFQLKALKVPTLEDFTLELYYPAYLNKTMDVIRSTGNAIFPEGTRVLWKLKGRNTDQIQLHTPDTLEYFSRADVQFTHEKRVFSDLDYQISTSNENVGGYEKLNYQFSVIRDGYPQLKVTEVRDSLNPMEIYFKGEVTDDYKVVKIGLVAYPEGAEEESQRVELLAPGTNFEQFYYTFPSGLSLVPGTNYEVYFTATDNDGIRNSKTSKSNVFRMRLLDQRELEEQRMDSQQELLGGLNRNLKEYKSEKATFEEIRQKQKEKTTLSFKDQTQIKDFLRKQQRQEEMMEKFSRELKENMEQNGNKEVLDEMLRERLERREKEAKRMAELMEELRKVADKIDKEELSKRLEELGKQKQRNERSLEQVLELTKRYYVSEKMAQLARDLEKLAREQMELSKLEPGVKDPRQEQSKLNEEFRKKAGELNELRKDNEALKKPFPIGATNKEEEGIKSDQKEALEELLKQKENSSGSAPSEKGDNGSKVRTKQQGAAEKLEQMSQKLRESGSNANGGSTITEDVDMLRQILDNLVTFSFKQERLFEFLEDEAGELANFSHQVKQQQELRDLFSHIDDSLFALSLRRAEISDLVNEQITEVFYNMDKALESIAEDRIYQGVSHQQYVLTAANTLADFLASLLDNMQESLKMGSGSGNDTQGFQLPDIIKSQEELQGKMGQKGSTGSQGEQGEQEGDGNGKTGKGTGEENGGKEGSQQDGEGGQEGSGSESQEGRGSGTKEGTENGYGEGGMSEEELNEVYEIYKAQQRIREALEKQLDDIIQEKDKQLASKLIKQMEDFENDLLENGITERTISKVNRIRHELLKLENATLEQGEKEIRESRTNEKTYVNPVVTKPRELENYGGDVEMLNRQALPLQKIYQDKVKEYFKGND